MLITVTRTNKTPDGSYGHLSIDIDPFKCVTLENLLLIIPAGTYDLRFMWSEHFQQMMPHVLVPGRSAIEIHWANYPTQLAGCLCLGTDDDFVKDDVSQSKKAWIGFVRAITDQPSIKIIYREDYGPIESA